MSAKTKILVIRSRNLILGASIAVVVILLLLLLFSAIQLSQKETTAPSASTAASAAVPASGAYVPGVYSGSVVLGNDVVNLLVYVDKNHINAIAAEEFAQTVASMYPLVPSVLNSLESQILSSQDLFGVTYADSTQVTAGLLLQTISRCLELARSG